MDSRYADVNVVVYFAGNIGNIYQFEQWIKPLEQLDQIEKILVVTRDSRVYEWIETNTQFQLVYTKTMNSLLKLYDTNNFRCIFYVNNSCLNFQSLCNNNALHVHINHGESEKTSTFSNRAKAYDFVFIVSDAAYTKYADNLINVDMKQFIKVGRPQIDFIKTIERPTPNKKIILYAPTWEGTHLSMNYTSLPDYGIDFVSAILKHDDYYLIYRPHPNTGSRDASTKVADEEIKHLVDTSNSGILMTEENINSVFKLADLAIFDNSAVTVDFLAFNKPMMITDFFYRQEGQAAAKPEIIKACQIIDDSNKDDILSLIEQGLSQDPQAIPRQTIKKYFLGDYTHGESTKKFINQTQQLIKLASELVAK
ncbi:MAG: CDP-glycerol glycerophosphotransferase family protein [Cocleimonas sp.]|nr:CDP-glycerol glycerophosphotransferase family protein [Cocleimonas sp.]